MLVIVIKCWINIYISFFFLLWLKYSLFWNITSNYLDVHYLPNAHPQTTVNKAAMNSLTPTTKSHHPGWNVDNKTDQKKHWKSLYKLHEFINCWFDVCSCSMSIAHHTNSSYIAQSKIHIDCRWTPHSECVSSSTLGNNEHFDRTALGGWKFAMSIWVTGTTPPCLVSTLAGPLGPSSPVRSLHWKH